MPCAEQEKLQKGNLQGRHESYRQNDFNFGCHFDIELKLNCYFLTKGGDKVKQTSLFACRSVLPEGVGGSY